MSSAILWLIFIAYMVFLSYSKKYKALLAVCKEEEQGYGKCVRFFLVRGTIALFILIAVQCVLIEVFYADYDFMLSFYCAIVGIPYNAILIGKVLKLGYDENGKCPDRQEKSGKPSEKRPRAFYLFLLLPLLAVVSYFFDSHCLSVTDLFAQFPMTLLFSAIILALIVGISNTRHNIGLNDKWSKASIAYWFIVAGISPFLFSLRAGFGDLTFNWEMSTEPFWTNMWHIDEDIAIYCYIISSAAALILFFYLIGGFYRMIGGQEFSIRFSEPDNTLPPAIHPDSGANCDDEEEYEYEDDEEEDSLSFHFKDMTEDYYGKHGEFAINDEARRVSEDIQQFHNAFPDADLSDQYFWDDILDAETDGFLDDN